MSTGSDGLSRLIRPELTALGRGGKLSWPTRVALQDGIIKRTRPVHDFGCGRGGDVRLLRAQGYKVTGWDLHYPLPADACFLRRPTYPIATVLLIYVINTIPTLKERISALVEAFNIAEEVMVVAIRGRVIPKSNWIRHNDGFIVPQSDDADTFQRSYTRQDITSFVQTTLGKQLHMPKAEIGYVFKNSVTEREYLQRRLASRTEQ